MGVFAAVSFEKGAFLCEYTGELIKAREGYIREEDYANVPDATIMVNICGKYC